MQRFALFFLVTEATHTFTQSDADWGFSIFVPLDEVLDPKNGWSVGDAVVLQVGTASDGLHKNMPVNTGSVYRELELRVGKSCWIGTCLLLPE